MDYIFFILAGLFLGILTGLCPGLHINTISIILLSLIKTKDFNIVLLIISMSIMHTFLDFVPSIILGVPSTDTFLASLPGHRYILQGRGFEAIKLTMAGGLLSSLLLLITIPILSSTISSYLVYLKQIIPIFLIIATFLLLNHEKGTKKIWVIITFLLSGILGTLLLNTSHLSEPLLPTITGLFATSTLIYSLKNKKISLPVQKTPPPTYKNKDIVKGSILSVAGSILVAFFPSFTTNEAVFLFRKLIGEINTKTYFILLGGINTCLIILSYVFLYTISTPRTGAAIAIGSFMSYFTFNKYLIIVATIIFSIGISFLATNYISKLILKNINKFDYKNLNIIVLVFIIILVFSLESFFGIFILLLATLIGLIPITKSVSRLSTMGILIIPTLLIYLNLI